MFFYVKIWIRIAVFALNDLRLFKWFCCSKWFFGKKKIKERKFFSHSILLVINPCHKVVTEGTNYFWTIKTCQNNMIVIFLVKWLLQSDILTIHCLHIALPLSLSTPIWVAIFKLIMNECTLTIMFSWWAKTNSLLQTQEG